MKRLLAGCLLAASPGGFAQEPAPVEEQVTVVRVEVTLHVTDKRGRVVPGLQKEDFQLFIDDQPVPIESLEWEGTVSASMPRAGAAAVRADAPEAPAEESGRLIAMLFQTHVEGIKNEGLMRMKRQALQFIDTLGPKDRVAVLVAGARLHLSLDFTADRAAIRKAVGLIPGVEPPVRDAGDGGLPRLAPNLSEQDERAASSIEKQLALMGRALRPLPGSKAILFFGWAVGRWNALGGPGDYGMGRFLSSSELEAAQRALAAAQAPVFTLDVSSGAHQLEAGLKQLSFETGGFYIPTHTFPGWAMQAVTEAIKGHYVLVFAKPPGKPGPHRIRIDKMRGAAPIQMLYRQEYDDSLSAPAPKP
jgi:VWFA-related protein